MIKPEKSQFVLEEVDDLDQEPGEEEIREYAEIIGIDPDNDPELMWIARAGITAPLPPDWKPVQMNDGELYFYNFTTNESSWEHPSDERYRQMVKEERKNLQLQSALSKGQQRGSRPSSGEMGGGGSWKTSGGSPAPLLPPSRPSSGKLAPIGSTKQQALPNGKSGNRLAPLITGGKQQPSGRSTEGNNPVTMSKKRPAKQEPIGLSLERERVAGGPGGSRAETTPGRPKTSRGTSDRHKPSDSQTGDVGGGKSGSVGTNELKLGGSRFLKSAPVNDVRSGENMKLAGPPEQTKPEIMSFTPRDNGLRYDLTEEEESSEDSVSDELHIGGSNILLDASHLKSPTDKKKMELKRPPQKQLEPNPTDSNGETLPRDPSNSDKSKPGPTTKQAVPPPQKNPSAKPDIEKMEADAAHQIRAARERIEREKSAEERKMRADMEASLKGLKQELERESNEELERLRKGKEEETAGLKAELSKMRRDEESEKKRLLEAHQSELNQIKREHLHEVDIMAKSKSAKENFEKEEAELRERFERELGDMEAEYEGKLSKARREWKEKLESEKKAHRDSLASRNREEAENDLKGLQEQIKGLESTVKTLREELGRLVSEVKEVKAQTPAVEQEVPPLPASTPKKKNKENVEGNEEENSESLDSEDSASSTDRENLFDRRRVLRLPQEPPLQLERENLSLGVNAFETVKREREMTGKDVVAESLAQLQKDLRALTVQVCGPDAGAKHFSLSTATDAGTEARNLLGSATFVDELVDKRWSEFSNHDFTYPIRLQSNVRKGQRFRNIIWEPNGTNRTDEKINQLKIWLKNFEQKLNQK